MKYLLIAVLCLGCKEVSKPVPKSQNLWNGDFQERLEKLYCEEPETPLC